MCWSGEASAVLAVTGFASTAYFYKKGESKVLCAALAYFSLMELLQAYTYTVIDECFNPNNQIATFLGYMHIAFQPFFVNAVAMHFIPENWRKRIAPWVYSLCFAAAVIFNSDTIIEGVDDSKRVPEKKRLILYDEILKYSVAHGFGIVSEDEIDEINILQASLKAMRIATRKLKPKPDLILIDGNKSFASRTATGCRWPLRHTTPSV